jgi:hypothetical protein
MRGRYRERGDNMADEARLVYFVIFGLERDREMIRDILSYLQRCRHMPPSTLLSPWHPFLHGMNALGKITGGWAQAPKSSLAIAQFDDFLNRVAEWERNHLAEGPST